jgi:type I restriction enzyme S subunit
MILKRKKLGDILNFKRGYDLPSSDRINGNIPVISSAGITDFHNEFKKDGEGIITGRYGTLGQIFYINGKYWPLNTTLYITDFKGNFPKFIYYFLKTLKLERFNGAAAVPGLDRNVIHKADVLFIEDHNDQKTIASILSSYDELIENNNQRIKLLDEMAEEIYKEWFVRFRFPCYEKTKFIDGLPEGWEYKRVDEFNSFKMSESKLKKFNGTKTYLATADISGIDISSAGEQIDWENKPSRAQLVPELNSVFFARMSNTYKVLVFSDANKELIDDLALTSGFLGLKAINENALPFLFWFIKSQHFHNYKDVYANGATQVSLTNEGFHMIKLIEPSLEVIEEYGKITTSFLNEILILNKKNQVLQQTRDLLLPRLISGKLSVEHLVEEENLILAAEPQSN